METYNAYIMEKVRENLRLQSNDESKDNKIMKMSKLEVFQRCLMKGRYYRL